MRYNIFEEDGSGYLGIRKRPNFLSIVYDQQKN